jgi:transcriptional regulator with XRE-family HTH domain
MTETPTLGATIRARRIELGWSQQELAERISGPDGLVRQSEISRLELDKVGLPRRARLERIAMALELPLGELLVRSGWNGAAAAVLPRQDTAAPEPDRPLPDSDAPTPPFPAAPPATTPEPPETVVRLRAALDRARDLRLRSASALDRARRTYDLANAPAGKHDAH